MSPKKSHLPFVTFFAFTKRSSKVAVAGALVIGMRSANSFFLMTTKAVVGVAEVTRRAFPYDTADEPGWVAVELKAIRPFAHPVTLAQIKVEPALAKMVLLRISRLSVQPVSTVEFAHLVKMGN